ncbi:hypothetical protein [Microcella sp.]|uniref:hypothetical protein n=1 Tax=Microcella sp. TaxID=1913979 RepID=UPI00256C3ED7|nr:hypothetical protein [Microcella sp.]MBX9471873.1 hypothetical protein [Microcella sp.]
MVRRIVLEIILIIGIAIALAWLVLAAFALTDSADPVGTLVDQTPRVLFGLLGIALGLWTVLLVIGAIVQRRRAVGWRIGTHIVSLIAALVVNIGVLTVVSVVSGGGQGEDWGILVVAIAVAAGGLLMVAGVISVLLVELVILRPKKAMEAAATGPETAE